MADHLQSLSMILTVTLPSHEGWFPSLPSAISTLSITISYSSIGSGEVSLTDCSEIETGPSEGEIVMGSNWKSGTSGGVRNILLDILGINN